MRQRRMKGMSSERGNCLIEWESGAREEAAVAILFIGRFADSLLRLLFYWSLRGGWCEGIIINRLWVIIWVPINIVWKWLLFHLQYKLKWQKSYNFSCNNSCQFSNENYNYWDSITHNTGIFSNPSSRTFWSMLVLSKSGLRPRFEYFWYVWFLIFLEKPLEKLGIGLE